MSTEKKRWLKIGTIMKSKEGAGSYVKITEDVTLKKGQCLTVQDPRKRPGITEEQLQKIPPFVKYEIVLPPAKD